MSNNLNLDYPMLGLNTEASAKDIKRAYAKCLKTINQETQAAKFKKLRAEYEYALDISKNRENNDLIDQNLEQATSELQIESEIDLIKAGEFPELETPSNDFFNQSVKPSEFVPVEIPYALMEAFNLELVDAMNHHSLLTLNYVETTFNNFLAIDEFLNFESRDAFEYFIIDSLYKNLYGINNLIVLWAAKKVFNWDQTWRITTNYNSVFYVDDLLLNFGNHQDSILKHFLLIVQNPNPKDSKLALAAYQELVNINQFFAEFCVPTDHLKNWQQSFNNRNFLVKFKDTWVDKIILVFNNILDLPPFQRFVFMVVFFGCIRIIQKYFIPLISK